MNRRSRSACLTGALLTVLLTAAPALADYDMDGPAEGVDWFSLYAILAVEINLQTLGIESIF